MLISEKLYTYQIFNLEVNVKHAKYLTLRLLYKIQMTHVLKQEETELNQRRNMFVTIIRVSFQDEGERKHIK